MQQIFDLIIIGAGAAGMSAAIKGAACGQSVMIMESGEIGGRLNETEEIQDLPGFPQISGPDLVSMIKDHLEYHSIEIVRQEATSIDASDVIKSVWSGKAEYTSTAIVIATGGSAIDWITSSFDCDREGRINAGEDCRTLLPCVYAVGNARNRPYSAILNDMADGTNAILSFLEDIM